MSESAVRIDTKIETKNVNAQLLTLENRIIKTAEKADRMTQKLEELGKVKIKTEEYAALEKELAGVNKEVEKLYNKYAKLSDKSTYSEVAENAKANYMEIRNYADQIEQRMVAMAANNTMFIDPKTTEKYKETEQNLAACNREMEMLKLKHTELKKKQKDVNANSDMFLKKTTKLLGRMLIFSIASKAFFAIGNVMKSGLQDLAQYSKEYNENMSAFSSATMELKYNLASAAGPVLNMLIPAFSTLVGWINTAVEAVSMFLAILSGKSTYTRAKKQLIDYAKSVKDAEKANKGALASFDELNLLNDESRGDSAGGAVGGADAFEDVEINSEFIENLNRVKESLEIILPYVVAIGVAFGVWNILSFIVSALAVTSAFEVIFGLAFTIGGLILAIYSYFQMWENGIDWNGIIWYIIGISLAIAGLYILFGPVVAGIALIVGAIAGLVLAFKDIEKNGLTVANVTLLIISVIGILLGIMIAFGTKAMWIVTIIGIVIGLIAAAIKWTENGAEALNHLKDTFKALGDFVSKVFAGDMEGAFESLKDAGRSFGNFFISVAEGIANGFIKMANAVIDAINNMLPEKFPDWVPLIGGEEFPKIPYWDAHVEFQRLANGGITTGSTLANIGEAGKEVVLPLERNTEWADILADKINTRGGETRVIVELDGKVVYNNVVKHDREFAKRTGSSNFAY